MFAGNFVGFVMQYLILFFFFWQIIGRVFADPDLLPRSNDFGLNVEAFKELFCQDCPDPVLKLAVMCAQINPETR